MIIKRQKVFANLKPSSKTGKNILHAGSLVEGVSKSSKITGVGKDITKTIKSTSKQARDITGDARNSSVSGPNTTIVQHLGGGRKPRRSTSKSTSSDKPRAIQGVLFEVPKEDAARPKKIRKITGEREILIHENRKLDKESNSVIGNRIRVKSLGDISRESLDPELDLEQYK